MTSRFSSTGLLYWWLTRGWSFVWALGLSIIAWRAIPPFVGDALPKVDAPWVASIVFACAAVAMLTAAIAPREIIRYSALGVAVFAMALRITSLVLVEDARVALDTRVVGIVVWTMLAVATTLLTVVSVAAGRRVRR